MPELLLASLYKCAWVVVVVFLARTTTTKGRGAGGKKVPGWGLGNNKCISFTCLVNKETLPKCFVCFFLIVFSMF